MFCNNASIPPLLYWCTYLVTVFRWILSTVAISLHDILLILASITLILVAKDARREGILSASSSTLISGGFTLTLIGADLLLLYHYPFFVYSRTLGCARPSPHSPMLRQLAWELSSGIKTQCNRQQRPWFLFHYYQLIYCLLPVGTEPGIYAANTAPDGIQSALGRRTAISLPRQSLRLQRHQSGPWEVPSASDGGC